MIRALAKAILSPVLGALAGSLAELPKNDKLWAYTIDLHGVPYMTRILLPRIGTRRLMIHRIWRPDADRHLHDHPWKKATSFVLTGGYLEVRRKDRKAPIEIRRVEAWSLNRLDGETFHRIDDVDDGTWTLFLAGDRFQEWGFLMDDGTKTPSAAYFAARGYTNKSVRS